MQRVSSSNNVTPNSTPPSASSTTTSSTAPTVNDGKFSIVDLTDEVKLKTQLKGDKLLKVNKQFRSNTDFQANYFFFKTDKNDRKKRKNSSSHSVVTPTESSSNQNGELISSSQYDAAIHDSGNNNNQKYSHKRRNTISGISLLQTTFNVSGLQSDSLNQLYNSNHNCNNSGSSSIVQQATGPQTELNEDQLFINTTHGSSSMNNGYCNDSIYTPTKVVRVSSSFPNFGFGALNITDSAMMDYIQQYSNNNSSNSNSSTPRSFTNTSERSGMVSPPPSHNNGMQRVGSFGQSNSEFDFFSKLVEMEGNQMFNVGGSNSTQSGSDSIHRQRRASIRRASVSTPRSNGGANDSNSSAPQRPSIVNMNNVDLSELSQSFNYQQFKQRYRSNQQPIKIPKPNKMREAVLTNSSYSYSPVARTPISSHSSDSDTPIYDFLMASEFQSNDENAMIDAVQEDSIIGSFENVFLQEEQQADPKPKQQEDESMDDFLSMFLP